jgi:phytoene dehydrogenase-like protein
MVSCLLLPPMPHQRYPSRSCPLTSTARENDNDEGVLRVVVVGGGIGGLAVASRIVAAQPSCKITVFEKNEQIGGRSGSFDVTIPNVGTFRHERGPSLLLLPQVYHELFHDPSLKKPAQQIAEDFGLVMLQCTPAYQVVFDDGDRLNVGFSKRLCDADDSIAELYRESRNKMDSLEVDGAAKWDEYLRAMSAFLDCGLPNFIEERLDLASFPAFIKEALRDFGKVS